MSFVRHQQPGVTRVLPHVQNRRYAVPNRAGGAGQSFLNVLAVGDSIMAGGGIPNGQSPADNWSSPRSTVKEAGAGRTLLTMGSSMAAYIAANPGRDVVLMGGINDARTGSPLATLQLSLQAALTAAENAGVAICVMGVTPAADDPGMTAGEWTVAKNYNAWADGECRSRGHRFLDPIPAMQDPSNPETLPAAYRQLGTDPLHLSQAGAEKLAGLFDQLMMSARISIPA